MTSTDLVVQSTAYSRASLHERQQYVAALAKAGDLLPVAYRGGMVRDEATGQMRQIGSPGKVMLIAETGDMLGIHPMAALTGVHIIEGKPSLSANLMSGLVRKAGHRLRVKVEGTLEEGNLKATAWLKRADDDDFEFVVTWTIQKAERAGLYPGKPKSNWQSYPEAMLKARAISEIIREGASDVLMGGNVYTPEELGAVVDEQGEPVELQQVRDEPAPDVSRETPEPRPETPIVSETAQPETQEFDWKVAIAEAKTKAEMGALYQRARGEGILDMPLKIGRKAARPLGEIITEIGTAMAAAEAEAVVNADPDTGEIIEAEIVEEDGPAAVLSDDGTGDDGMEGARD